MMTLARRLLLAATACAAVLVITPQPALADGPIISGVAPTVWVLNGKPIKMVITGTGLTDVIAVNFAPPILQRTVTPYSDSALLVTLPADVAPGQYAVTVSTPGGGSDPRAAPTFWVQTPATVLSPAPPPPANPVVAPASATPTRAAVSPRRGSLAALDEGPARLVTPNLVEPARSPGSPGSPVSPALVGAIGALLGGLAYLLWTSGSPVGDALRSGVLVRAALRPARWTRLVRVCPQCSRLHWPLRAHKAAPRAGDYCSVSCLRAAVEEARVVEEGQEAAVWRLRKVVGDLQGLLSAALDSEVVTAGPDRVLRIAEAQDAIHWPLFSGSERDVSEVPDDFFIGEGQPLSPHPPEPAPLAGEFTLRGAVRTDRPRQPPSRSGARRGGGAKSRRR